MDLPESSAGHGSPLLCQGTNRQGKPCGNAAGKGTDHVGVGNCKSHCGSTKTHRIAAVEQQARQALARLDVAPVENPLKELALVAAQVIWFKDQVAERVNKLTSLRYSTEGGEQLRAEVALFERALDRCEKFLGTMARLRIDERLAAIEQAKADVVIAAIEAALAKAGVTGQAAVEAKREAARHLRAA